MDPRLILFLGIIGAVLLRSFWKELAELVFILLLICVFVGVLTLMSEGHAIIGG